MNKNRKFYDIHCHVYNLSHAGLLSFINRALSKIANNNIIRSIYYLTLFIFTVFNVLLIYSIAAKILDFIKIESIFFTKNISTVIDLVLLAFILIGSIILLSIFILRSRFFNILPVWIKKILLNIINIISVLENDIGSIFRYLEWDYLLLNDNMKEIINRLKDDPSNEKLLNEAEEIFISNSFSVCRKGMNFNKVIITPLMMDFENKGLKYLKILKGIHYKTIPHKPVVEQVVDVFNGIKNYMIKSPFKIFEIYPFMGINTKNYKLGDYKKFIFIHEFDDLYKKCPVDIKNKIGVFDFISSDFNKNQQKIILAFQKISKAESSRWKNNIKNIKKTEIKLIDDLALDAAENTIIKMLYKYFGNYFRRSENDLYIKFKDNYNNYFNNDYLWSGDIDAIRSFFFAGIKLYPPLGFNPWPQDEEDELKKVKYLYNFCEVKGIPLTVHCQDWAFDNDENSMSYTDPSSWQIVLDNYNKLRINFAHMGINVFHKKDTLDKWAQKVIEYLQYPEYKNVYADFACKGVDLKFYEYFKNVVKNNNGISDKIFFGSDFMMNLFSNKSYNEYLEVFFNAEKTLGNDLFHRFCNKNPEKFLFGK